MIEKLSGARGVKELVVPSIFFAILIAHLTAGFPIISFYFDRTSDSYPHSHIHQLAGKHLIERLGKIVIARQNDKT